jgi:uncharacterized membrane protein
MAWQAAEMTPARAARVRRLAVFLVTLGVVLAVAALARGVFVLWRPAPETWDRPELWLDGLILAGGLALAFFGFLSYRRALTAGRLTPATFLTADEERLVIDAIQRFEKDTSGEIRLHLCSHSRAADILAEARATFERLGLTGTRERNGVLFFVAVTDRRFAVLGDQGIDEKVPPGFWNGIVRDVQAEFAAGRFAHGLVTGIEAAGGALATFFPPRADDVNEMPDEISRR